jgi:hypothetical protein
VIRSGFEPETYCLEGSCSIQLSYRTNFKRGQNKGKIFVETKQKSRHLAGFFYYALVGFFLSLAALSFFSHFLLHSFGSLSLHLSLHDVVQHSTGQVGSCKLLAFIVAADNEAAINNKIIFFMICCLMILKK